MTLLPHLYRKHNQEKETGKVILTSFRLIIISQLRSTLSKLFFPNLVLTPFMFQDNIFKVLTYCGRLISAAGSTGQSQCHPCTISSLLYPGKSYIWSFRVDLSPLLNITFYHTWGQGEWTNCSGSTLNVATDIIRGYITA